MLGNSINLFVQTSTEVPLAPQRWLEFGTHSAPGQVQHYNRVAPKSSDYHFAIGYTENSIRNSWPFSSLAMCWAKVSVSSGTRPEEEKQNQNPKANNKKRVYKEEQQEK